MRAIGHVLVILRLTACSSWCPKYSPSCVLSSSEMCSRKNAATAEGLFSIVPEPMSADTPFTGSLQPERHLIIESLDTKRV